MSGRPRFTITLGHPGQVVKRDLDDGEVCRQNDCHREYAAGAKRTSAMDRLGNDHFARNKRQRRDNNKWRSGSDMRNGMQHTLSCQIGQNDLRLKLMQKDLSRKMKEREQSNWNLYNRHSTAQQHHSQYNAREDILVSKTPSHLRRIPPTRSADSFRKSYSSLDMNGVRHRSPDRFVDAKGFDDVSSSRSVEHSLPTSYVSNNVIDSSRPLVSQMNKVPVNLQGSKPIAHLPPPGTSVPKSSFTFDERLTVVGLLNSLGLAKYGVLFQAEEIDMAALKQMGDGDLKDLGIPMGPRKKILRAVAPRT